MDDDLMDGDPQPAHPGDGVITYRPGDGPVERAPRLRPDQYIADAMTRVGRFAGIDPLRGRDLPSLGKVLGVVGWAVLVGESFRRAYAQVGGRRTLETSA